jgi:uncharacterized protein YdeI (YjbR/CyaY-like superfamily)
MPKETKWKEELELLSSIFSKLPFDKANKWGGDVFIFNGKNIASFGGFKHFFTIWFYNGVFLKDPYQVLINASEGKTKSLRQWRFTSINEINEQQISTCLLEAIEIEKKGLKVEKSTNAPPLPEILEKELNSIINFKESFEKLTPGRQKEFILFLIEAKSENTKLRRLEKIKKLVLQGIGLTDKYK